MRSGCREAQAALSGWRMRLFPLRFSSVMLERQPLETHAGAGCPFSQLPWLCGRLAALCCMHVSQGRSMQPTCRPCVQQWVPVRGF